MPWRTPRSSHQSQSWGGRPEPGVGLGYCSWRGGRGRGPDLPPRMLSQYCLPVIYYIVVREGEEAVGLICYLVCFHEFNSLNMISLD